MTNSLFRGKRTHVAAMIYRTGYEVTITRADGTAVTNQYGKVSDGDRTFETVTTEHARRIYEQSSDEAQQSIVQGGRLDEETPRIAFKHDTDAETGDRVAFPQGQTYTLDRRMAKDTHVEFRATLVQE